jgi:flagellar biosynthesis/type III secretory pathway protein FliH
VHWAADKSIELGGCVIETDGGTLDARLETQVEGLRAALVAARG